MNVVQPKDLGLEFVVDGSIEAGKIRLRLGGGLDIKADGTIFQNTIIQQFSGQYLCDPNEINGWGVIGFTDNTNSQDLGNVGANNLSRIAGGLSYPFDVRIKRFHAWHQNNNGEILPWGWVMFRQQKNAASNTVTTTFMLDESFDRGTGQFGLRNYGNTTTQLTDITSFVNDVIPAGDIIGLGVGSPTAVTTNRYVRVMSGYIELERI